MSPALGGAAVDAGDDVGALAVDLGVAVEVAVGAELLDEVDRRPSRPSPGWSRRTMSSGRTPMVTLVAGVAGEGLALDRDDRGAELDAAVGDVGRGTGSWPGCR